jgi:hypothetical protein
MQPLVQGNRDIGAVLPVFIPSSFVAAAGGWPGPCEVLQAADIALAWAVPLTCDTTAYILYETEREWEAQGIDWKARALENLRALTPEPVGTGALFRDNGETWLISLMHADGLGPSRLLLADQLERMFPKGYRVALPERSRAFAFSADLDREDFDTVETLIRRSYATGERPLSCGIFEPNHLLSAMPKSTTKNGSSGKR